MPGKDPVQFDFITKAVNQVALQKGPQMGIPVNGVYDILRRDMGLLPLAYRQYSEYQGLWPPSSIPGCHQEQPLLPAPMQVLSANRDSLLKTCDLLRLSPLPSLSGQQKPIHYSRQSPLIQPRLAAKPQ